MPDDTLLDAFAEVARFKGVGLTRRIAQLEVASAGCSKGTLNDLVGRELVSLALLRAAVNVKRAAAQIDVVVHATGMLLCLPEILDSDEVVESVSLGAANTGRRKAVVILRDLAAVAPSVSEIFLGINALKSKSEHDAKVAALEAQIERLKRLLGATK